MLQGGLDYGLISRTFRRWKRKYRIGGSLLVSNIPTHWVGLSQLPICWKIVSRHAAARIGPEPIAKNLLPFNSQPAYCEAIHAATGFDVRTHTDMLQPLSDTLASGDSMYHRREAGHAHFREPTSGFEASGRFYAAVDDPRATVESEHGDAEVSASAAMALRVRRRIR